MKKQIYILCSALFCALALASCADDDYTVLDKGSDVLTLTSVQATDALQEINHASNAVTLNWTTGNNYGTGNRIYYKLELASSGTDFANAYTAVDNETQLYSWSVNQEDFNNLLIDNFGSTPGTAITLDARVTATVEGENDVQTSTISFTATPYKAVTPTLYLIGDATPNGWSADNATEMTRTEAGFFQWEGNLTVGSYKFITTLGEFLPSYNKGDDGNLVYRSSDDEPDNQFSITEANYYKVTANLLTGAVTCTQEDNAKPPFGAIFFTGDMTSYNFVQMVKDPLDAFLFRYGRLFDVGQGGEFKFGTTDGSWENMYKATSADAPYTDASVSFVSGFDPDNKWKLQDADCGKAYKICLDIHSGKERMMMREFTPYANIYLVGDACAAGWTLPSAVSMTATSNPYVFTWTGALTAGELKFSCDNQTDWNGAWFMCAGGNDLAPTGSEERALFIDKSDDYLKNQYTAINIGDIDYKWKIANAGTYTITLDQLNETISIVKQ